MTWFLIINIFPLHSWISSFPSKLISSYFIWLQIWLSKVLIWINQFLEKAVFCWEVTRVWSASRRFFVSWRVCWMKNSSPLFDIGSVVLSWSVMAYFEIKKATGRLSALDSCFEEADFAVSYLARSDEEMCCLKSSLKSPWEVMSMFMPMKIQLNRSGDRKTSEFATLIVVCWLEFWLETNF